MPDLEQLDDLPPERQQRRDLVQQAPFPREQLLPVADLGAEEGVVDAAFDIVRGHRQRGERVGPLGQECAHPLLARGRVWQVGPFALEGTPVGTEAVDDGRQAGAFEGHDPGEVGHGGLPGVGGLGGGGGCGERGGSEYGGREQGGREYRGRVHGGREPCSHPAGAACSHPTGPAGSHPAVASHGRTRLPRLPRSGGAIATSLHR